MGGGPEGGRGAVPGGVQEGPGGMAWRRRGLLSDAGGLAALPLVLHMNPLPRSVAVPRGLSPPNAPALPVPPILRPLPFLLVGCACARSLEGPLMGRLRDRGGGGGEGQGGEWRGGGFGFGFGGAPPAPSNGGACVSGLCGRAPEQRAPRRGRGVRRNWSAAGQACWAHVGGGVGRRKG